MSAARACASALRIWHLTTGEAGTRQQARGLATALSPSAEERVVKVSRLWALAPSSLIAPSPPVVTSVTGRIEPPWPDVLVTCGRRSALVAMAIRRRNPARMICVHIQPPQHPGAFDLVVALPHDRLEGENVIQVDTALHGVSPGLLAAAVGDHPWFRGLPRPWTGVLLGGSTKRHPFRVEDASGLADQLDALRRRIGGSLLITPSRRTPPAAVAVLGARYLSDQTVRIWDGGGPNPYVGILAMADRLVVTSDSISMTSEALATTAAVSVFRLKGGRRHEAFIENLMAKGLVTPLGAPTAQAPRPAIDATPLARDAVLQLLSRRLGGTSPRENVVKAHEPPLGLF